MTWRRGLVASAHVSTTIDPQEELLQLGRSLEAFIAAYRADEPAALLRVPVVSGWSLAEHFYHLCLATDLALRNVQSLVRGKGRLITHEGGANTMAEEVLARESFPRGEAEAPRIVQPPDSIDPALLSQELDLLGQALERTRELLPQVPTASGRIPHQALGPLDAAQWLRFARLHAAHHLSIARDLRG